MKKIAAVILAAGRGTRMKSEVPKVLQKLHSRPLLSFVIDMLEELNIDKKILVVGHKDKIVKGTFKTVDIVVQQKLLGSGDAVKSISIDLYFVANNCAEYFPTCRILSP